MAAHVYITARVCFRKHERDLGKFESLCEPQARVCISTLKFDQTPSSVKFASDHKYRASIFYLFYKIRK